MSPLGTRRRCRRVDFFVYYSTWWLWPSKTHRKIKKLIQLLHFSWEVCNLLSPSGLLASHGHLSPQRPSRDFPEPPTGRPRIAIWGLALVSLTFCHFGNPNGGKIGGAGPPMLTSAPKFCAESQSQCPKWCHAIGGKHNTNITIAYFMYIGSFFILLNGRT